MVSGTVQPYTMDVIATAIIPQNVMAMNSKDQIIAISATISSLSCKPNGPGSISKAIGSLKTILLNRSTAF
eukprot:scaffold50418_cov49-Attheya_sp.AAC.2